MPFCQSCDDATVFADIRKTRKAMTFSIDKKQVQEGEYFTVSWDCQNPDMVSMTVEDGSRSQFQLPDSGSRAIQASGNADKIVLTLRASIGGKVEEKKAAVKVKRKVLKAEKVRRSPKSSSSGGKKAFDFSKISSWWNNFTSRLKMAWSYMPENKKLAYKILGLILLAMILAGISPKLMGVGLILVVGYLMWIILKR